MSSLAGATTTASTARTWLSPVTTLRRPGALPRGAPRQYHPVSVRGETVLVVPPGHCDGGRADWWYTRVSVRGQTGIVVPPGQCEGADWNSGTPGSV